MSDVDRPDLVERTEGDDLPPIILTLIGGPCAGRELGEHVARTRPETIMVSPGTHQRPVAYGHRRLHPPTPLDFYVPAETDLAPDSLQLLWAFLLERAGAR